MTKPSKEVEKIEQLLADPWAVDIQGIWEQAAHNPILINVSCLTRYTLIS